MFIKNFILGLTAAVFFAAPVLAADPPVRKFNIQSSESGAKYITGGVGDQQQAAMERRFSDYSFKLVNVRNQGQGAYVSKVDVSIQNKAGKTVVKAVTEGPWLFADLEAGTYNLTAKFNGATQERKISIRDDGHERQVLKWDTSG